MVGGGAVINLFADSAMMTGPNYGMSVAARPRVAPALTLAHHSRVQAMAGRPLHSVRS